MSVQSTKSLAPIPQWAADVADTFIPYGGPSESAISANARHNLAQMIADAWQGYTLTIPCPFCSVPYPYLLTEHIKMCTKHPMRAVEEDNRQLSRTVRDLITALEIVDDEERELAAEQGRSARVHTGTLRLAEAVLLKHGLSQQPME